MLIRNFSQAFAVAAVLIASTLPVHADDSALKVGALPHDDSALVAGSMPYSNQWTFDEPDSFLYISRNQLSLNAPALRFGQLESRFEGNGGTFYGVDYFARLTWFKDRESNSWLRQFSLNGRYGLSALVSGFKPNWVDEQRLGYGPAADA